MLGDRLIFHADCNNFFASCECLTRPELKNVPMAVAGDPEFRTGIVVAKNELAKKYGVKTTDSVYAARKKCPELVLVPPRHRYYSQISRRVNAIYHELSDLVEPASIDESFLDMTGTLGYYGKTALELADGLRARVREEIGLTISVGVSFNKTFAKLGSDYKKPDATTEITRENYRELLWPLPIGDMLGVGRAASEALRRRYILTIGDLARSERAALVRLLGKWGGGLWDAANALDDAPVVNARETPKSVSRGMTFKRDLIAEDEVRTGLAALANDVAAALRREKLVGEVVQLQIRTPDMRNCSRQLKLDHPTDLQKEILQIGCRLIREAWRIGPQAPIRALTLGISALTPASEAREQLSLFDLCGAPAGVRAGDRLTPAQRERQQKLETAMDEIRGRYGAGAISMGVVENAEIGVSSGLSGVKSGAWAETEKGGSKRR